MCHTGRQEQNKNKNFYFRSLRNQIFLKLAICSKKKITKIYSFQKTIHSFAIHIPIIEEKGKATYEEISNN